MNVHPLLVSLCMVALFGCLMLAGTSMVCADTPSGNTAGSAPTSTATPASNGTPAPQPADGIFGFLPDPKQWATEVFNQVIVNVLRTVADALHSVVGSVLGSSLNFITQTPPASTYASSTVQSLWNVVRVIANAALALAALWGGITVIVHTQTGSPYHDVVELLPRLVLGALLANTSLAWGQLAIDLNNALCDALGPTILPAWDHANDASQLLVAVIALLVYLVTALLLLIQMLMRLALIDVLLVVAPLALLCWVLPQTQGWARLWSSTYFGAVFTQFVQVLALKLGAALVTELAGSDGSSPLLSFFLGVAVLALTLKIPGLLRHQVGDGLGFVRYVAYRQGAQMIGGSGGSKGGG